MADHAADLHVLSHIDQEELVELGTSLVRIPSFIGEETPVARWLAIYFGARGYEVELQEVERGRFQTGMSNFRCMSWADILPVTMSTVWTRSSTRWCIRN